MNDGDVLLITLFTTLIIFLLIAGILITIFYGHRRAQNQRIAFAEMQLAYQRELRSIESEVKESTLTHVAEELHDNIGQMLAVMNVQLEKEKIHDPGLTLKLAPVSNTLQSTMEQVRLLSHSLSNDFIAELGLQQSIAQEAVRLQALGKYAIHFESDETEPSISKDARTVVFRIFQESISNVLKHAKPKNICIDLYGAKGLILEVCDDGKGFDKETVIRESQGLGLKSMVKRAALAGFLCEIESEPGKGSKLTIRKLAEAIA